MPEDAGYDAKAIARWDVVPYQVFADEFHVGVVAFHINGIDRVDFSVNGGAWTSVTEMQLNPRTNTWEYTGVLRASDFAAGPVEVRAIAWPSGAGEPRVLDPVFLYADPHADMAQRVRFVDPVNGNDDWNGQTIGTAMRTLHVAVASINSAYGSLDGATVRLLPGDYDWTGFSSRGPTNSLASITFEAAEGVAPDEIRFLDLGAGLEPRIAHVVIRGVSLNQSVRDTSSTNTPPGSLWIDECVMVGAGPTASVGVWNDTEWELGVYLTDSQISNVRNGVEGTSLVRGVSLRDIGEDAFKNAPFIINCEVVDLTSGSPSYHPDIVQYVGGFDNTIVYGLTAMNCNAQTFFTRSEIRHDNAAFVNALIVQSDSSSSMGQWLRSSNHVLFYHVTMLGRGYLFRDTDPGTQAPLEVTNLAVRNCVFTGIQYPTSARYPARDSVFDNCHLFTGPALGPRGTEGSSPDVLFANPSARDYAPWPGRTLTGRVQPSERIVPADVAGHPHDGAAPIGAVGESAAGN
ncbi:MAG: hypothetical protein SFY69_11830 [Planctomycetota bacterium]|nr:hypothetical protein [Planctomycetota bacterium]